MGFLSIPIISFSVWWSINSKYGYEGINDIVWVNSFVLWFVHLGILSFFSQHNYFLNLAVRLILTTVFLVILLLFVISLDRLMQGIYLGIVCTAIVFMLECMNYYRNFNFAVVFLYRIAI